jgi:hypothetical protein
VHRDLLFYARLPVEVSDDLQQLAKSPKPYLLLAVGAEAQSLMATPGVRVLREYPYLSSKVFSLRGLVQAIEPDQIVLLANFGS